MEKSSSPHHFRLVFAQNMRQIRRLLELSQEQLALEAGISKTYICEIERGNKAVSIDIMGKISDALHLPLDQLLKQDLIKLPRDNDEDREK